jgi:hypothetical protein
MNLRKVIPVIILNIRENLKEQDVIISKRHQQAEI